MIAETQRVLGIDPGTSVTGWGIVEGTAASPRRAASGVIVFSSRTVLAERLHSLRVEVARLIRVHEPLALSLEKAFVGRNIQSAFRLGEARGAVLIAAAECGLPVFEYSPAEVKLAVVGFGQAPKLQMQRGIALRFSLAKLDHSDEADALALGLCHLQGAGFRRLRDAGQGR
ncbi:MAG: crossover junction endodeoxyribonuclease RuvC [Candidatus Binatia bacterium]